MELMNEDAKIGATKDIGSQDEGMGEKKEVGLR